MERAHCIVIIVSIARFQSWQVAVGGVIMAVLTHISGLSLALLLLLAR